MKPTIGRIVLYALSAEQAAQITQERQDAAEIGGKANIDSVMPGAVYPLIVVRVPTDKTVSGQVLLDDQGEFLYVKDAPIAPQEDRGKAGFWHWPEKVA